MEKTVIAEGEASDVTTDMAQGLFTNLLLLGMDIADMEGHTRIAFNKDMFNLPNKVGSEAVLHFLFFRLNPSLSDEKFRDCWPIIDKKGEMLFRKICSSWIAAIQKNEEDSHLPKLNPALLLSPGGKKFIHLLYSLSTFVLTQVMKREHDWKPVGSIIHPSVLKNDKSLGSVTLSAIKDNAVGELKHFFNYLHLTCGANRAWKDYSDDLVKDYRGLTKRLREIEHELRLLVNDIADTAIKLGCPLPAKRTLTVFDSDSGPMAIKQRQRIEQVRDQFKKLKHFDELFDKKREIVQSIVDHTVSHRNLDGTDIGVCVPGLLLREYKKEIHQQQIDNVYVGGRLSLVPVLQMWNLCLRRYLEQISSEKLPDVSKEVSSLTGQHHKHNSFLKDINALRDDLSNIIIPELEKSIEELREKLRTHDFNRQKSSLGLELTKPMSPVTATPATDIHGTSPFSSVIAKSTQKDTPDVVAAVMQSVASKSHAIKTSQPSNLSHSFNKLLKNDHLTPSTSNSRESIKRKVATLKSAANRGSQANLSNNMPKRASQLGTSLEQQSKTTIQKSSVNHAKQNLQDKSVTKMNARRQRTTAPHHNAKALDNLANSIVDSVILGDGPNGNDSTDNITASDTSNDERNYSHLSQALASELDVSAFVSRDRLGRSPLERESIMETSSKIKSPKTPSLLSSLHTSLKTSSERESGLNFDLHENVTTYIKSTAENQNCSDSDIINTLDTFLEDVHPKVDKEADFSTPRSKVSSSDYQLSPTSSFSRISTLSSKLNFSRSPKNMQALNEASSNTCISSSSSSNSRIDFENGADLLDGLLRPHLVSHSNEEMIDIFDVEDNYVLGDRPSGDGEASDVSSPPPPVSFAWSNSGISAKNRALESNDSEEERSDNDFALPASRSFSSSTLPHHVTSPQNVLSRQSFTSGDESNGDIIARGLQGTTFSDAPQSLFESVVKGGLVDLLDSDIDEGLDQSFSPLKQGIHFGSVQFEKDGPGAVSPLIKTIKGLTSPGFPSLLSSTGLLEPSESYGSKSPPRKFDVSERLAHLRAKAALVLEDSDDSL